MEDKSETVMYSQFQPWSTVAAPPCMEQTSGPPVPIRTGQYYQTPKRHPWRPTLGYENVEVTPLYVASGREHIAGPSLRKAQFGEREVRLDDVIKTALKVDLKRDPNFMIY